MQQRILATEGVSNLRDVGGYKTQHGRQVAWGRLLRSGHLAEASAADCEQLLQLGIGEIHDFRRYTEREMHPTPALAEVKTHLYELRMGSSQGFIDRLVAGEMTAAQTHQMMVDGYRSYITHHQDEYGRLLHTLAEPAAHGALLHCTAGKDRTGVGIALVLLALGVDQDTVLEDYLLTINATSTENVLAIMGRFLAKRGVEAWDREAMRPYCTVHADYLVAALAEIDAGWPSPDAYLREALNLDAQAQQRLRDRFLEP
jgi:protein-tyrosine phosphatase